MGAINKVVFGSDTLIDLTGDSVTPETLATGTTAHDKSGAPIVGTAELGGIDTSDANAAAGDLASGKTAYVNGKKITGIIPAYSDTTDIYMPNTSYDNVPMSNGMKIEYNSIKLNDSLTANIISATFKLPNADEGNKKYRALLRYGASLRLDLFASQFGNATAADVVNGKTFTSNNGLKITGTAEAATSEPVINPLEVTSNGTYAAPTGVDGYSPITVNVPSSSGGLPDVITPGDTPILGSWVGTTVSETTVTATDLSVTIPKSGTYRFYVSAVQSSSYSMGGGSSPHVYLYKNGSEVASDTVQSSVTSPISFELDCSEGDAITVYAMAMKSSYYTIGVKALSLVACINNQ